MAHARKQIRDAIVTLLTGLTTTGTNVSASRVYPHADAALPSLVIYTVAEEVDIERTNVNGDQVRNLQVMIEGRAKAAANIDNTLDLIASEVESALGADYTLGGVVKESMLSATEIELNGEIDQAVGVIRMTWLMRYRVNESDPDTIIA